MVDYSKWDKVDVDSDDSDDEKLSAPVKSVLQPRRVAEPPTAAAAQQAPTSVIPATSKGTEGRLKFEHEGRTIYEWEQSLEEVNIYVQPPPGVKASMIDCKITHSHLTLGLKGNPPFLDEDTGGPVKSKDSFWMMERGEININLQKMNKGEIWDSALKGRGQMDPFTTESVKKQLMLERFQEENPGFDFSGAEFNGAVPDPRTFMGGVKYS